jgi:hypothetical protein
MPLSPSKRGYAFQHTIKDYFVELGFIAQEEHPATRTDICLTHSPLEIAVECKHVKDGVTLDHAQRFDERLKLWQKMGRPCLGVMVATRFQEEAEKLCEEKNILCVTQQQMDDALERRRASRSAETLPISHKVADFLRTLSGLFDNWIPHLFGDPVDTDSFFLDSLLAQGYATLERELSQGKLLLDYSDKGKVFFAKCRAIFDLLQETEIRYSSAGQVARGIAAVLLDWSEEDLQVYDRIMLIGLGILDQDESGSHKTTFADDLLRLVSDFSE